MDGKGLHAWACTGAWRDQFHLDLQAYAKGNEKGRADWTVLANPAVNSSSMS